MWIGVNILFFYDFYLTFLSIMGIIYLDNAHLEKCLIFFPECVIIIGVGIAGSETHTDVYFYLRGRQPFEQEKIQKICILKRAMHHPRKQLLLGGVGFIRIQNA